MIIADLNNHVKNLDISLNDNKDFFKKIYED